MKPGPGLFITALLWLVLAAAAYFFPVLDIVWIYAGLLLIFTAALDFLVLYFLCDRLEVKREIQPILSQGNNAVVKLTIHCKNSAAGSGFFIIPFKIRIFDLYPVSMELTARPSAGDGKTGRVFPVTLDRRLLQKGRAAADYEYSVTPTERGLWSFGGTQLLLSSACRFWELKVSHKCESSGRTYPDFKKLKAGADLRGLLERTGVKNIRRRGQGMDFRSLRDYQDGDSIRDIDWRAVSRRPGIDGRLKLIVREYQEEQDQQVLFLLDSGYRLHKKETEGKRTQFDSALEAVLLLSWVSLKHGDSVAAASFGTGANSAGGAANNDGTLGTDTSRWIFAGKGMAAFPRLMNGLYDLKSSPAPSSPFSCLEEALSKLKRRTFIILISNFREEDGESLSWILNRINRRHLLLLVSLMENDAQAIASRNPANADEALETAAAFSYLGSRRELYSKWEHQGLLTLEASAKNLPPALINRYLQVKRSGRL